MKRLCAVLLVLGVLLGLTACGRKADSLCLLDHITIASEGKTVTREYDYKEIEETEDGLYKIYGTCKNEDGEEDQILLIYTFSGTPLLSFQGGSVEYLEPLTIEQMQKADSSIERVRGNVIYMEDGTITECKTAEDGTILEMVHKDPENNVAMKQSFNEAGLIEHLTVSDGINENNNIEMTWYYIDKPVR